MLDQHATCQTLSSVLDSVQALEPLLKCSNAAAHMLQLSLHHRQGVGQHVAGLHVLRVAAHAQHVWVLPLQILQEPIQPLIICNNNIPMP